MCLEWEGIVLFSKFFVRMKLTSFKILEVRVIGRDRSVFVYRSTHIWMLSFDAMYSTVVLAMVWLAPGIFITLHTIFCAYAGFRT